MLRMNRLQIYKHVLTPNCRGKWWWRVVRGRVFSRRRTYLVLCHTGFTMRNTAFVDKVKQERYATKNYDELLHWSYCSVIVIEMY